MVICSSLRSDAACFLSRFGLCLQAALICSGSQVCSRELLRELCFPLVGSLLVGLGTSRPGAPCTSEIDAEQNRFSTLSTGLNVNGGNETGINIDRGHDAIAE